MDSRFLILFNNYYVIPCSLDIRIDIWVFHKWIMEKPFILILMIWGVPFQEPPYKSNG